ncbi:mevalonate 3,5-bisphosphate decarboxylase [Ferroplasma acidiphilum]|uniref:Mevalonate pyrophosphate decarboxylase n=1 Tax=Ferroplasma acidiphilum TaxID=74969 RepID=A0A7K4FNX2_9ARCH|nr:mevalonate 3,5-bisphosphate decarboxylase [Ferroplasma acidiphilum]NOL60710.1 mevalonate pyrophosphate decarboxylase [Ferroplasma acidiphilum]
MDFKFEGENIKHKLVDMGLYRELINYDTVLEPGKISTGYSYPIKAFEKFLGYYDNYYKIANNPSTSFNTDFSFVYSACMYTKKDNSDMVILDGKPATGYVDRYEKPLEIFRKNTGIRGSFVFNIKRYRKYSEAKGLSESSAVASAVSRSLIKNVFGEMAAKDDSFVSRYARLVSGSGTRAAINGPSIWLSYPGIQEQNSFAVKIPADVDKINYAIFPKNIDYQTSNAHSEAVRSIFYNSWLNEKYKKLNEIIDGGFNIELMMNRAMEDMYALNSVLLSRGNVIQTAESISLLKNFIEFSKKHEGIYITGDTGPSLMVMSADKSLLNQFLETVDDLKIVGSHHPEAHKKRENEFRKESEEYFQSI